MLNDLRDKSKGTWYLLWHHKVGDGGASTRPARIADSPVFLITCNSKYSKYRLSPSEKRPLDAFAYPERVDHVTKSLKLVKRRHPIKTNPKKLIIVATLPPAPGVSSVCCFFVFIPT